MFTVEIQQIYIPLSLLFLVQDQMWVHICKLDKKEKSVARELEQVAVMLLASVTTRERQLTSLLDVNVV